VAGGDQQGGQVATSNVLGQCGKNVALYFSGKTDFHDVRAWMVLVIVEILTPSHCAPLVSAAPSPQSTIVANSSCG